MNGGEATTSSAAAASEAAGIPLRGGKEGSALDGCQAKEEIRSPSRQSKQSTAHDD